VPYPPLPPASLPRLNPPTPLPDRHPLGARKSMLGSRATPTHDSAGDSHNRTPRPGRTSCATTPGPTFCPRRPDALRRPAPDPCTRHSPSYAPASTQPPPHHTHPPNHSPPQSCRFRPWRYFPVARGSRASPKVPDLPWPLRLTSAPPCPPARLRARAPKATGPAFPHDKPSPSWLCHDITPRHAARITPPLLCACRPRCRLSNQSDSRCLPRGHDAL